MCSEQQIISDFQTMYNDRWGHIPGSERVRKGGDAYAPHHDSSTVFH
jgi:hypothetical protein